MLNLEAIRASLRGFRNNRPFDHCVVDGFFEPATAEALAAEFPDYEHPKWFHYRNPIEDKKALNDWNVFPALTYRVLQSLNALDFVRLLSEGVDCPLTADPGLHGGGWHIHASGGNLNPHLDYSIHPKLGLQRKVNVIVYLSRELEESHGGHLGLWEHDAAKLQPGTLVKEVAPNFNRAIIFDTTQNSWHGMSRPLTQPPNIFRKSLATYYLCEPKGAVDPRGRALFAPRPEQENDPKVREIIRLRSQVQSSDKVYKT